MSDISPEEANRILAEAGGRPRAPASARLSEAESAPETTDVPKQRVAQGTGGVEPARVPQRVRRRRHPDAPISRRHPAEPSSPRKTSRDGKVAIAGHFKPEVRRQLHQMKLDLGRPVQALLEEALNELFKKYGQAPIAGDPS